MATLIPGDPYSRKRLTSKDEANWLEHLNNNIEKTVRQANALEEQGARHESRLDQVEYQLQTLQGEFDGVDTEAATHTETTIVQVVERQLSESGWKDSFSRLGTRIVQTEDRIDHVAYQISEAAAELRQDYETRFEQTAQELLLKASATTVTQIGDRVREAEATLSVTADRLQALVREVDRNEQRTLTNFTQLTQTAEAVGLLASRTETLESTSQNLYTELVVANEQLTATAARLSTIDGDFSGLFTQISQNAQQIALTAQNGLDISQMAELGTLTQNYSGTLVSSLNITATTLPLQNDDSVIVVNKEAGTKFFCFVDADATVLAGSTIIPITPQNVTAPSGSVVYVAPWTMGAELSIMADEIRASVSTDSGREAIAVVSSDIAAGTITSIPVDYLSLDLRLGDQITIFNAVSEAVIFTLSDDIEMTASSTNLPVESKVTTELIPEGQNVYISTNYLLSELRITDSEIRTFVERRLRGGAIATLSALVPAGTVTSLPVGSTEVDLRIGDELVVLDKNEEIQRFTVSADTEAAANAIPVSSTSIPNDLPAGQAVEADPLYEFSTIRQLSDEIDLRVTLDGVINAINISEEGILIAGSRLMVDADTVFADGLNPRANSATILSLTAPTTREDGSPIERGDIWIDTSDRNVQYTYDGTEPFNVSGWIRSFTTISGSDVIGGTLDMQQVTISASSSGNQIIIDEDGLRGIHNTLGTVFNLPLDGSAPTFSSGELKNIIFKLYEANVITTSADALSGVGGDAGVVINDLGFFAGAANQDTSNANVRIKADGTVFIRGQLELAGGDSIATEDYVTSNSLGEGEAHLDIFGHLPNAGEPGLSLTSTHMGYHNGSGAWLTYMDNNGGFFLGGPTGSLVWNGSELTISGAINVTGGNAATASYADSAAATAAAAAEGNAKDYADTAAAGAESNAKDYVDENFVAEGLAHRDIFGYDPVGEAGLSLTPTHLGYHDGTAWKTYMDNTGKFFLDGASGGLTWDGTNLTINGGGTFTGDLTGNNMQLTGQLQIAGGTGVPKLLFPVGTTHYETSGSGFLEWNDGNGKGARIGAWLDGGVNKFGIALLDDAPADAQIHIPNNFQVAGGAYMKHGTFDVWHDGHFGTPTDGYVLSYTGGVFAFTAPPTGPEGTITGITAGVGLAGGGTSGGVSIELDHLGIEDLADPGADRLMGWDDSAGTTAWLTIGSGLTLSGTTLTAAGESHTPYDPGDVTLTNATVISQLQTDISGHIMSLSTRTLSASDIGAASAGHNHDGRYFTETEINTMFSALDKNSVGLGNLQNYSIASQIEAEAGTSNTKYMTPQRVAQAIAALGNAGDITNVSVGGGLTGGGSSGSISISHADTSSQASVNNSGATLIQDISLDTYGHVTDINSKTLSYTDVGAAASSHNHTGDTLVPGRIECAGDVLSNFSDIRLKQNLKPLHGSLDNLARLRAVRFEWIPEAPNNMGGLLDVGLIAQEVAERFPEAVREKEGFLTILERALTPHLVAAIGELYDRVRLLEMRG